MKHEAVLSTIPMSRGSGFKYELRGKPGDYWPESGTAYVVFYESTGAVIATLEGTVKPELLLFEAEPTEIEFIPHGAGFELFVTPDETGVPVMVRYGTVTRREVRFPDAPATDVSDTALLYVDDMQRTILGPRWRKVGGKAAIYDDWISLHPKRAIGPDFIFFDRAAVLWFAPLNLDSVTVNVNIVNAGAGKSTVVLASDYNMTSWLGVQFETGISNNKWHIVVGHSPQGDDYEIKASVDANSDNGNNALIKFNHAARQITAFRNNGTTPILTWTDEAESLPIGDGFRYTGFSWISSLAARGVCFYDWWAKDGV
ncbi:hypothetical protein SEA_ZAKAI_26 [Mycobacterium phage Zakai]|nr:hypothetical protein SEA_ZAKAI_26 [Mycobacterium phage Zakai]